MLGSNSFIDGFESGLVGAKKGEEVTLNLTFPDPYQNNPDLAGQAVVFEVKVNNVKEKFCCQGFTGRRNCGKAERKHESIYSGAEAVSD